jgi:hypothetical protein
MHNSSAHAKWAPLGATFEPVSTLATVSSSDTFGTHLIRNEYQAGITGRGKVGFIEYKNKLSNLATTYLNPRILPFAITSIDSVTALLQDPRMC